jgi:hypothetical protein
MEERIMAKIQLNVELENANSKERFELECPYESDSAEVSNAAATLSTACDNESIISGIQNALAPQSELHKHFLSVFAWKGHDKAGWHDVLVFIQSISVNDTELSINADEISTNDLTDSLTLQLVRPNSCGGCGASNELSMHFVDS